MRVTIIQKRFHPNSLGIVLGLQKRAHVVNMIVHRQGSVTEDYSQLKPTLVPYSKLSIKVIRLLRLPQNSYAMPKLRLLWQVIQHQKPNILVLKKTRLPNIVAALMGRLMGAKLVLLTNDPPKTKNKWHKKTLKILGLSFSQHICTTANEVGALKMNKIDGAWFRPYPISIPILTPPYKTNNTLNLIMVGAYQSKRKRLELLIKAVALTGIDPHKVQITFVGTGSSRSESVRQLSALALENKLQESVSMFFNIPRKNIYQYYQSNDVFVMTARNEPFGMVVLEAMANGLPVISNETVGASDCVINKETGLLYKSDSAKDLAEKIRFLYDHPNLRQKMGVRAREIISQKCSPDSFAQLLESFWYNGT